MVENNTDSEEIIITYITSDGRRLNTSNRKSPAENQAVRDQYWASYQKDFKPRIDVKTENNHKKKEKKYEQKFHQHR